MKNANNTASLYRVIISTVVDHPERRDETYPVVPAGTVITDRVARRNRAEALSYLADILAGGDDFGSEYVSRVYVQAQDLNTGRVRNVRLPMSRAHRGAEWVGGW